LSITCRQKWIVFCYFWKVGYALPASRTLVKKLIRYSLIIIALLSGLPSWSQPQKPGTGVVADPDLAKEHYGHQNYVMALPLYLALVKKEPNNYEYNYRLGICYLNTNNNKKEAVKYFEFCTKQPKADNDAWLFLGQAYHHAMRWDDAITAYTTYKLKADKAGKDRADLYIQQCSNGKVLIKTPLNVTFEALGKEVNSEFPDYYPFVTQDESMLCFTSRRKGNVGSPTVEMDGYFASDIYFSRSLNGVYGKAKNAGAMVNGNYDEQCVGLSADGSWMTVYVDNISTAGEIMFSAYNKSFAKPVAFDGIDNNINSGFETAGSLSPDGSVLFFASERDGGQGGTDLWMVRKLPNGKWSLAQNLGAVVNTEWGEDFPYMAPDGKTLYFSSEGHNSMGGYDLFYTIWDCENNTFTTPKNIGYPINNTENNMSICYTEANRVAYISTVREGGLGDLDIWRVVFNDIQDNYFTLITGQVVVPDPSVAYADVMISVTRTDTQEEYGSYKPNAKSGKYTLALPPGKYVMTTDAPGCATKIETLIVFDIGPQGEMSKDVLLTKAP
jgi:tetratricopeptide (TPR) repeat protein